VTTSTSSAFPSPASPKPSPISAGPKTDRYLYALFIGAAGAPLIFVHRSETVMRVRHASSFPCQ
jgi:hypothetical protein